MKCLITGASGFVGYYLATHLARDLGFTVYATKLPEEPTPEIPAKVLCMNVLERASIRAVLEEVRPDGIFHLAAQSSVAFSWREPRRTVDINIGGCVNLLEEARGMERPPRVLLVGSSDEYGWAVTGEAPVDEETATRPGSVYALTKVAQNMLGAIYAEAYNLDILMTRAFNHIGPGQSPGFVVADFCRQIAMIEAGKSEPIIRVGNIDVKRDFTDVRDVVRAYGALMVSGRRGETYNIGSGQAVSIAEILEALLALSSVPIRVERDPARYRPSDLPVMEADTRRIRALTGWAPEIPLADTLRETLEDWRKKVGGAGLDV